jgi:signal transduction histidine kinase
MEGKTIHELFPSETAAQLEPSLRATIDGEPQSFDIEYVELTHHLETAPVSIDGEDFGVLVTQDVTDARQTAAALERQNQRLASVASILSHDLRNPLTTAQGYLELERQERGQSESLNTVARALDRMEQIIADLMDLARADGDRLSTEPVSVSTVVRDAWEMVETGPATIDIAIDTRIQADRSRLQRLFENLFRNAVEHGGPAVTVTVEALTDGFYVEDDGPGIPEDEREKVFDFGYSTRNDGTGFGLNVVEAVARAHGWDVRITEGSEGGARFEIMGVKLNE